jgi:protoporphyrinogen oxidase
MRVAVVGGGISGLTVAGELARRGLEVVVFEKSSPGGLAAGFPYPNCPGLFLDKFYRHIFTSDRQVIAAIEEHGLGDELLWLPSRSGLIAEGRTWPFGSPLDLLRFKPMGSFWQRLRMGLNLRYFTGTEDWQTLDGIPCRDFFASRGNLAGFRGLWEPLLRQKFADAYDNIPTTFLWGRIHPRAASRGKGGERLGYLKGGFQRLFNAMVQAIRRRGGDVRSGHVIDRLRPGRRPEVIGPRGGERFDRVVWTAGLPHLVRAVENPTAELRRKAEAVQYMAVTQLIVTMRRRQGDFYWLNNLDPEITFGGLIEHTNLVPAEHYGGEHILYVVNYHRRGDPRFEGKRVRDVFQYHLPSLRRILPAFREEDVLRLCCCRSGYASPLYDLGFAERMPPYQGWLENVDVCGMAQVYPVDRNMNYGMENALRYLKTFPENDVHSGVAEPFGGRRHVGLPNGSRSGRRAVGR